MEDPYSYMNDEHCQELIRQRNELRELGYDVGVLNALIQARITFLFTGVETLVEEPTDDNKIADCYIEDI
jgi:hypothetical protein